MRERFESDEFKTYMEAYRAAEQARVEELSRNEEFVRVPEFPPESSLSARNALRRRNRRKQRSILAGLLSAIGTAAGAVLIVAAVVLTFTQVSLTSFSAATHSLEFELAIEWAENSELTARLTSESEQHEQSLSDGDNNYTLRFDELTPDTEYHLEITDGSTVCFSGDYRTEAIEPLTPVGETLLPDGISLTFDGTALTGEYTVYLDGAAAGTIRAEQAEIAWTGLNAKTSYRVTVEDEHGDTVFDKTYHTPAYQISVTETSAELYMTSIRVELNVEHADAPLTATLGGNTQTLQNGANVLLATDLTPGTEYTLEVRDGEGNICFTKTYVTNRYEQKLFPAETVLQESITLQFDAAELTSDSYTVRLDGAEAESLSAAHTTLVFANLTPKTSYRVTIEDEHGDTVFDKTYHTPAYEISVTETAAELYMTRIRVELTVEHADTPLTAHFGGNTQTLQNGANMLEMTGLNPGSTYAISVYNGEEQVFFQTYRTKNYVQTLFTVEEYIGTDMIFLQFDEAALPEEGYTVYVAGALSGSLNKNNSFIQLNDLTPNTRYHIEILDSNGDLMLDAYYLTPYAVVNMGEVSCTPVSIRFTAFVESETGLADVVLRSASGEVYSSVISPETGGDISFTGLTPMTEYTLTITDDRGNVCYENVFRTELSYTLLSISGNQITLEFPAWQFDGAEGIELSLNGTPTDIVFAGGEVTLSDLTPQTEYSVSVRVNGVLWWQNSFTTPDIILDSAEPTVGSTDLSVTFRVQNPQSEPLRVVLLMGDIEQDAETFTEAEFTASFTTIPNGRYVVRLVRESDGLTLWQAVLVTNY